MEVVLQVPGALFDGVEDEVGVSGVKSPVQRLGNGHQVKVLHPPHLEARLLSGPLELWVVRCHPACGGIAQLRFRAFLLDRPEDKAVFLWQQAPDQWGNTAVVELCNKLIKVRVGLPICERFAVENIQPLPLRLSRCRGYKDKVLGYS